MDEGGCCLFGCLAKKGRGNQFAEREGRRKKVSSRERYFSFDQGRVVFASVDRRERTHRTAYRTG